jgi:hypothetical protein
LEGVEKRIRGRREGKGGAEKARERRIREGWSYRVRWEKNESEEEEETERTDSAREENENRRKKEENRDTSR